MTSTTNRNNNNQTQDNNPVPLIIAVLIILFLTFYYLLHDDIHTRMAGWINAFHEIFVERIDPSDNETRSEARYENRETVAEIKSDDLPIEVDYTENRPSDDQENTVEGTVNPKVFETPKPLINKETPVAKPEIKKVGYRLKQFSGANGMIGLKDLLTGDVVVEPQYDNIEYIDETKYTTYIPVRKGKWYGIIDTNNRIVIPFEYTSIGGLQFGKFRQVAKQSKYGLISMVNGRLVLPPVYEYIQIVTPTFFLVLKDGMYGCVNENNNIIVPFQYKSYSSVRRGESDVNSLIEFRDSEGNLISYNAKGQLVAN